MRRDRALAAITLLFTIAAPASAVANAPVTSGLRGLRVTTASCTAPLGVSGDDKRIIGTVRSIKVCASGVPDSQTAAAVMLSLSTRPAAFKAMRAALLPADGRVVPGTMCPMYADMPRIVYVIASKGIWRAHLPLDGCHHYTPAVRAALARAT